MTTSHPTRFSALFTGLIAGQMLAYVSTATIIGSTSRGLFLLTPEMGVIFLSYESWCGPLTVNIGQSLQGFQKVSTGAQVHVSAMQIHIPVANIILDLRASPLWSAPPIPYKVITPEKRQEALDAVAELVCDQSSAGFSPVLAAFINVSRPVSLNQAERDVLVRLHHLRQAFSKQEFDEASTVAASLLGCGRGLTPSWDDLIAGLLLAFSRWEMAFPDLCETGAISSFKHHIISNAYAQTTALSANIIAASAEGQSDERLTQSLDALFSGQLPPQEIATLLLAYGASSGVDSLTGFALALSTILL
jgi:hypothetical protein